MRVSIIVQTEKLTRKFGDKLSVNQVDLRVLQGSIYGFLGPNGAGKTTTLKMLLGLLRPTDGRMQLLGKKMPDQRTAVLRDIGSLVESPSYYGHLTGYKNLKIVSELLGLSSPSIDEVLELVRLSQDAHRPAKEYSLGMKQRLGIAMALIHKPKLLILDEPTNGLDPAGIQEIRNLIKDLPTLYGSTLLVSSHLLSEVEQLATHVGIIHRGELIFQDKIDVLRQQSVPSMWVEVQHPREAYQSLRNQGWSVEMKQEALSIRLDHPEDKPHLFQHLQPYTILNVQEKKKSLEDIFIEWTGTGDSL
ncbi:ATP-binding cassette domain-containing protein [Kroppenstedtia pulmonis]